MPREFPLRSWEALCARKHRPKLLLTICLSRANVAFAEQEKMSLKMTRNREIYSTLAAGRKYIYLIESKGSPTRSLDTTLRTAPRQNSSLLRRRFAESSTPPSVGFEGL
jgi:hypothetical protein